jgi:GrpB-like predicted nucleotidyltransferase (UPF0157 family)
VSPYARRVDTVRDTSSFIASGTLTGSVRLVPARRAAWMGFWQDLIMDMLTAAGLGLDYGAIRLDRTTEVWLLAGTNLRDRLVEILDGVVMDVELVGSSSVLGLLAKPVIDMAAGVTVDQPFPSVTTRLEAAGWIYRGDAGDNGGHVFVLETWPWHRVAHLHVVEHDGRQWRNYLRFRDLLRQSPTARERYEAVKLRLAEELQDDRRAYTVGKTEVVQSLLSEMV